MNSLIKPISIFTACCSLAIFLSSTFCSTYSYASADLPKQINANSITVNHSTIVYFHKSNLVTKDTVSFISPTHKSVATGMFTLTESAPQEASPFEIKQEKGNEFFEMATQFNDKLQLFISYVKQLFSISEANASGSVNSMINNTQTISHECSDTN